MNQTDLLQNLSNLPLGKIRYFDSIGSTNDEALQWIKDGASDLSLVIADEQTAGRGRLNRKWFTPPGTALAFSLILRPTADEKPHLSRIVGLAALSLLDAFSRFALGPQIKWPNDVLLNGSKVAGILTEALWSGDQMDGMVIGIGINVAKGSVPAADMLQFPAISLEHILGAAPNRINLLSNILTSFISLRPHMHAQAFMSSWEKSLAYYGKEVCAEMGGDQVVTGKVTGLESDGSLKIIDDSGKNITVRFGDVRLRLAA